MQPLTRKDPIHHGNILVRRVARSAHRHDQNPRLQAFRSAGPPRAPCAASPAATTASRRARAIPGRVRAVRLRPRQTPPVDMAQRERQRPRHHRRRRGLHVRPARRLHQLTQMLRHLLLHDPERPVLVHLAGRRAAVHGDVAVAVCARSDSSIMAGLARVQPGGGLAVRGDDGDFVGVVTGEVGVEEDEDVGDCGGEREGGFEDRPGMRVCVEDDG